MSYWHSMSSAPTDGAVFIRLYRTTVIGGGTKRHEFHLEPMYRQGDPGFWMGSTYSISDQAARVGWWAYRVPVDNDGKLVLPRDAFAEDPFNLRPMPCEDLANPGPG